MISQAKRFWNCEKGNFAIIFALMAPVLLGVSSGAVNYAFAYSAKSRLQGAADSAALAAAQELYLSNTKPELIEEVAKGFVIANLGENAGHVDIAVSVGSPNTSTAAQQSVLSEVTVSLDNDITVDLPMPDLFGVFKHAKATSVARISGGGKICMIGLEESGKSALAISGNAKVIASECAVYSNSADPKGLSVTKLSKLTSELACSSGGFEGAASNYDPQPLTDCPSVKDPLTSRVPQMPSNCNFDKMDVKNNNAILTPGVYCKKLTISASNVTLRPGVYVFWDCKVKLDKGARISGDKVSLVFIGKKSGLDLKNDTEVALSASEEGPMAGILIYADSGSDKSRHFKIESSNARKMVGTIYLPHDKLTIGGDKDADGKCDPDPVTGLIEGVLGCKSDVGEFSDWTAIVANEIEITSGVRLVLNTDYSGSSVPVPSGVGPVGGNISLAR